MSQESQGDLQEMKGQKMHYGRDTGPSGKPNIDMVWVRSTH